MPSPTLGEHWVAHPKRRRIWPTRQRPRGLEPTLPAVVRRESDGDAKAVRFLLGRFPSQHTRTIHRETRLMANALLDDHRPAVRQLVRVLCAHPLAVTLPGPVMTRLIETALPSTVQKRPAPTP